MAAKNFAHRMMLGKKIFPQEQIDEGMKPELFFYQCQVTKRDELIPKFARKGKGSTFVERIFN